MLGHNLITKQTTVKGLPCEKVHSSMIFIILLNLINNDVCEFILILLDLINNDVNLFWFLWIWLITLFVNLFWFFWILLKRCLWIYFDWYWSLWISRKNWTKFRSMSAKDCTQGGNFTWPSCWTAHLQYREVKLSIESIGPYYNRKLTRRNEYWRCCSWKSRCNS